LVPQLLSGSNISQLAFTGYIVCNNVPMVRLVDSQVWLRSV